MYNLESFMVVHLSVGPVQQGFISLIVCAGKNNLDQALSYG